MIPKQWEEKLLALIIAGICLLCQQAQVCAHATSVMEERDSSIVVNDPYLSCDIDTLCCCEDSVPRQRLISLRTNLLADVWYQPQYGFAPAWNIQAEYYPKRGHYTLNFSFTSPYWHRWSKNKFFQIRDYRLSLRRYFKGDAQYVGWFANVYGEAFKYGIGFNAHKGWQGEGGGAGLGLGYVTKLNRRGNWRMEFIMEAGYLTTRYDPYVYGNPISGKIDGLYYYDWTGSASSFKKRNYLFNWFGPTMVGIQLSYDILYRKVKNETTTCRH